MTNEKLSSVKYLVSQFREIEDYLRSTGQNLDFGWLRGIESTFSKLFNPNYDNALNERQTSFSYFSRNELELISYIFLYNTAVSDSFPFQMESLMEGILVEEGISLEILNTLRKEIEFLGDPN